MNRRINPALVVSVVALVVATGGAATAAISAGEDLTPLQTQELPPLPAGSITTQDLNIGTVARGRDIEPLVSFGGIGGRLAWTYDRIKNADQTETIRFTYRNVSGGASTAGAAHVQVLVAPASDPQVPGGPD